jgi:hypothetical protein
VVLATTVSLAAAGILTPPATGVAAPGASTFVPSARADVITGLIATRIAPPRPVVAADGKRHLVYELKLTNATPTSVTVVRVKTLDRATGKVLDIVNAPQVAELMVPFGEGPGGTLRPGGSGFILMDTSLPKKARVPARLIHEFRLAYGADLGLPTHERTGRIRVERERPRVIAPPLAGGRWLDVNGCCGSNPHRQAVIPINGRFHVAQRFAIDFIRLSRVGRLVDGPPGRLSSYPAYGARVISAAPGTVVRIKDGIEDNVPVGSLPPLSLKTIGGNFVVIDIGRGHFAYYAHLQPGSVTVDVGDHVRRGHVLGRVGNSGNSDLPHLHFHVMATSSPLGSNGLPYEFAFFGSRGTLANPGKLVAGGRARFDPTLRGAHARQLPMELQDVRFPAFRR